MNMDLDVLNSIQKQSGKYRRREKELYECVYF